MNKPSLNVSAFSDYICPFCYIGSRRLLRLQADYDLRVNWCGVEIHPDTPATGASLDSLGYPPEHWRALSDNLARLAVEEGVALAARRFTTNSRRALLLAELAKEHGREVFYALHTALFRAFFEEGRNIGQPEVLDELAGAAGLPGQAAQRAWHEPRYKERLERHLQWAKRLGLRGVPAFVVGERLLTGAVPERELRAAAVAATREDAD